MFGSEEAKVPSIVGAALEHPRQHEADHRGGAHRDRRVLLDHVARRSGEFVEILLVERCRKAGNGRRGRAGIVAILLAELAIEGAGARSEERRVGKECVSKCRSRWSPQHKKQKNKRKQKK